MWPLIVAAGLSAASNIYTNYKNSQNVDKQNAFNYNMWKHMNDYNRPDEQVNRLRAAGINPALALGNISTGNASGSVQSANHQPTVSPLQDLPNVVNNGLTQSLQYDMMQKQKQEIDSKTRLNNANASGTEQANKYIDKKEQSIIANTNAGTEKIKAETDLSRQVWENNKELLPLQNKLTEQQIDVYAKTSEKLNVEIDTAKYDLEFLKPLERKMMNANISNIYAGIALTKEKVLSEQVGRDMVRASIEKVLKEVDSLAIQNNWSKDTYNARVNQVKEALRGTIANTDLIYKNIDNIDHREVMDWCNFGLGCFNSIVGAVK